MSQIILDISANTFKNDEAYYKRMVDELSAVDTRKNEVILKWQLFEESECNIRARKALFVPLSGWAFKVHRYKTTASVFDIQSLSFLLECELPYKLPFIKIANNRKYDWLIGEIPRKYMVYKSVDKKQDLLPHGQYFHTMCMGDIPTDSKFGIETPLFCISEYPASIDKYPDWCKYISDHTVGLELFHRNQPVIWEKHLRLEDSTGLDAGPFAITPRELGEIL